MVCGKWQSAHLELVVAADAGLADVAGLADGAVVVIAGDVRLVDAARHVGTCEHVPPLVTLLWQTAFFMLLVFSQKGLPQPMHAGKHGTFKVAISRSSIQEVVPQTQRTDELKQGHLGPLFFTLQRNLKKVPWLMGADVINEHCAQT